MKVTPLSLVIYLFEKEARLPNFGFLQMFAWPKPIVVSPTLLYIWFVIPEWFYRESSTVDSWIPAFAGMTNVKRLMRHYIIMI
jgi:hypothetical protein